MSLSSSEVSPSRGTLPTGPAGALRGPVFITRQVHFNASHRLHNPAKSEEWNAATFGLCNNANGHGHNYVLEATVRGQPAADTGYIIDLGALKKILERAVVDACDHRNLNADVEFLRGLIPSTENLVVAFWQRIEPLLTGGTLHCIRLYETPRNYAEYFGPATEARAK